MYYLEALSQQKPLRIQAVRRSIVVSAVLAGLDERCNHRTGRIAS
jgi:hypothetical protein